MFLTEGNSRKKLTRSTDLLANFRPYWRPESNKSFADGWAMAVGPWYRDQLDIELSTRVKRKTKEFSTLTDDQFKNHLLAQDGVLDCYQTEETKEKNGKITTTSRWHIRRWTQGPCFCFSADNIIYDTPIAHTTKYWRDAIPYINIGVKVLSAAPNTIIEIPDPDDKFFREGFVTFKILRPEKIAGYKTSRMITESTHTLSQNDFVRGLMNGVETVL